MATGSQHDTLSSYKSKQSHALGAVIVAVGCLSIVFNIVDLAVTSDLASYSGITMIDWRSLGYIGHGIWCGVMYIITGAVGIKARGKKRCPVITFIVLCIACTLLSVAQFAISVAGAGMTAQRGQENYGCLSGSTNPVCESVSALIAMEALMAFIALIVFITSIWGSCIGGAAYRNRSAHDTSLPTSFTTAGKKQMTFSDYQQQRQTS
jgi:hypothetical protein